MPSTGVVRSGADSNNLLYNFAEGITDTFSEFLQYVEKVPKDQSQRLRSFIYQKLFMETPIDDPIHQTMRWKIERISTRIRENRSLLSRVFCSSPNGYHLRLRIDFHGANNVLLHVVLVHGDNDDQLRWPFQPTVTIGILGGAILDVCETMNAVPVNCCYSEVQGNVLCSLSLPNPLRLYLIDDCLFVRCTISL